MGLCGLVLGCGTIPPFPATPFSNSTAIPFLTAVSLTLFAIAIGIAVRAYTLVATSILP